MALRFFLRWLVWGAVCSGALAFAAAGGRVALRPLVGVRNDRVYLADLLSENAGPELRASAAVIEVCRGPEVGSRRVLAGADLAEKLQAEPDIARQLVFPPELVLYRPGWPVNREQAWSAIVAYLVQHGLDSKEIPPATALGGIAGISTVRKDPRIEVRQARLNPLRNLMEFDLDCTPDHPCNPFLTTMPATRSLRQAFQGNALVAATSRATVRAGGSSAGRPSSAGPILIRAGQPATLMLEGGGMRIVLQVISLTRGALGQQVRARDAVNRRVFAAEVTGLGQLHAQF